MYQTTSTESGSGQLSLENSASKQDEDEHKNEDKSCEEKSGASSETSKMVEFLLVHGGMDTEGNIFDDLFFINLS